jgi:hypothetical protein
VNRPPSRDRESETWCSLATKGPRSPTFVGWREYLASESSASTRSANFRRACLWHLWERLPPQHGQRRLEGQALWLEVGLAGLPEVRGRSDVNARIHAGFERNHERMQAAKAKSEQTRAA